MDLLDLLNHGRSETPSNDQLLFSAAARGDIVRFERYHQAGGNLSSFCNGFNSLHVSVRKKHLSIVRYILHNNPQALNIRTSDGRSSVMLAAYEGSIEILKEIQPSLSASTTFTQLPISDTDEAGNTPLHYAAWGGNFDCVSYLIDVCGADPTLCNKDHMTSLQYAAAGNHIECLSVLKRAILNHAPSSTLQSERSSSGLTTLHRAALHGSLDTVELLLQEEISDLQSKEKQGDWNPLNSVTYSLSESGNTALHLAAQRGMAEVVQTLVRYLRQYGERFPGVPGLDMQNDYGLTPLHFGCIG